MTCSDAVNPKIINLNEYKDIFIYIYIKKVLKSSESKRLANKKYYEKMKENQEYKDKKKNYYLKNHEYQFHNLKNNIWTIFKV